MSILLDDDKIRQIDMPHLHFDWVKVQQDWNKAVAKAQLKAVAEWGYEVCSDETHRNLGQPLPRRLCSECWQALKKEAE